MKSKPYKKYRSSGVEWLGEVPEHWSISRFRRLVTSIRNGTSATQVDEDEESLPVTRIETISKGVIDLDRIGYVEQFKGSQNYLLKKGDILLSHINSLSMIGNCAIYDSDNNLYSGMNLLRIIPRANVNSKWLWYFVVNDGFKKTLSSRAKPAINQASLTTNQIREMSAIVPSLPEQQTIAAFLDREAERIDSLIGKKQKLLELLTEKRTALISRAVTKGLNPKVKMKSSGEEWLGEVPVHWEVKRLKFILQEPLKYGANEVAELDDPNLPRFVRITDVDESGNLRDETFRSLPEEIAKPFLLDEGDLLFARSGATVGKTFFYRTTWGKAAYAGYLIRARLKKNVVFPDYINFITKSNLYSQWISSVLIQATIQNVSAEKYASYIIPLPPLPEQQAIAAFLDRETAQIDGLVAKVETVIDKLKEYRMALISAAITGKIDVRDAA